MKTEWLIERGTPPWYWAGRGKGHCESGWTASPHEALGFASDAEATKELCTLGSWPDSRVHARVVEHGFIDPPTCICGEGYHPDCEVHDKPPPGMCPPEDGDARP